MNFLRLVDQVTHDIDSGVEELLVLECIKCTRKQRRFCKLQRGYLTCLEPAPKASQNHRLNRRRHAICTDVHVKHLEHGRCMLRKQLGNTLMVRGIVDRDPVVHRHFFRKHREKFEKHSHSRGRAAKAFDHLWDHGAPA